MIGSCYPETRAYLHHLFNSKEILGPVLATMHNIAFYQSVVKEARLQIVAGTFGEWKIIFVKRYNAK
jgi:queuine tRNA-ribosyltransferase